MRIAFFDAHAFEREAFQRANESFRAEVDFLDARLTEQTAKLAAGHECVCAFVNDRLSADVLRQLAALGVRLIALRSAGYNHVDLFEAEKLGLTVVRVPEYSPHAVAEHAAALVLALNRHIPRASARVRDWNFSLDGLVGFDLHGKTVGVVGTGRIGRVAATIFRGFGCRVLGHDLSEDAGLVAQGVTYAPLDEVYRTADILTLHVPLTPRTRHLLNAEAFAKMKRGVMIINTSRGALIDSRALLEALKARQIGCAGLDVYEEEEGIFFQDLSNQMLTDDVLARLLTFPNVLVTSHQAFLTREALDNIAKTTLSNIRAFEQGRIENQVSAAKA